MVPTARHAIPTKSSHTCATKFCVLHFAKCMQILCVLAQLAPKTTSSSDWHYFDDPPALVALLRDTYIFPSTQHQTLKRKYAQLSVRACSARSRRNAGWFQAPLLIATPPRAVGHFFCLCAAPCHWWSSFVRPLIAWLLLLYPCRRCHQKGVLCYACLRLSPSPHSTAFAAASYAPSKTTRPYCCD